MQTFQNLVSARYFDAMSIPLLEGRQFSSHDDEHAPRAAILNQSLARIMWPSASALGQRLTYKGQTLDVIGVVRDIKGRNLLESPSPILYLSLSQYYEPGIVVHLRGQVPPGQLIGLLRSSVQAVDHDLPVYGIKTLDEHVTATLTPQRLLAHIISGFGVLALVLAGIGLYGLLAHTVIERTPEIGIRMALGASKHEVMRLFVTRGMTLSLAGVVLGLAAAAGLTHLMKSVLFGVSPLDPLTLAVAPAVLILAAVIASWIPAHRAAQADPKVALRYE